METKGLRTGSASGNFWNVEYTIYGSTFIGSAHTVFSQDRIHNNPY